MRTRHLTLIGIMSALAFVLYLVEIPVGFLFPAAPFLKMDFSDIPAILVSLSLGPVSGILVEFFKNVLHFLFKSETPAASGEIANFFAGTAYFLPIAYVAWKHKTKTLTLKQFSLGLGLGTVLLVVVMMLINYTITLPLYGIPADQRWAFIHAISPFNVFKGVLLGIATVLIYPRVSALLKA